MDFQRLLVINLVYFPRSHLIGFLIFVRRKKYWKISRFADDVSITCTDNQRGFAVSCVCSFFGQWSVSLIRAVSQWRRFFFAWNKICFPSSILAFVVRKFSFSVLSTFGLWKDTYHPFFFCFFYHVVFTHFFSFDLFGDAAFYRLIKILASKDEIHFRLEIVCIFVPNSSFYRADAAL